MHIATPLFEIRNLVPAEDFSCRVVFHGGHPILQGHFPGRPVVPGAWLIRAVHKAVEQVTGKKMSMSGASQVKFLAPVLPQENASATLQGEIREEENATWQVNAILFHEKTVFLKMKATFSELKS